ncbi:HNH endonuclease [Pseudomonas putida]|uniref:HNH endonuclease n=1 Tax=Pseudomonas putida TaxID=303 RepID=UPI0009809B50|nr:HNH endonuclease signature motif containing protein [Pseudomonas putida]OMQ41060.1 hypothetical protein BKX96_04525 [Pseudomonas putida]
MSTSKNKTIKDALIKRDGLRCAISGEAVEHPDNLVIEHITPISEGGDNSLDNLILIKPELNSRFSNSEAKRAKYLSDEIIKRQEELAQRERESFEREQTYRAQIERQKQELEIFREQMQREHFERQNSLEREIEEHRQRTAAQQHMLSMRERETVALQEQLNNAIKEKESKIALALEELEREKEKYREESRNKIESRSSAYVNEALSSLDSSAKTYHSKGRNWSIAGSLALILGVGTGLYFGVLGLTPIQGQTEIPWSQVTFFAFKGVIVIGLFIALAKYCFTYSQSFTHEAIKNSERKHAINFGKFYLETYGAEAEWSQIKEAFEHWNINSSSAFSGNDADKFDPKIFDKAVQIAEAVQKLGKEKSDDKKEPPKP